MQTQRTGDGARHVARTDARHVASGAAALGAASDRASRQQPSRRGASAQGRRRRAHHRIPQGPPAEHDRRHRQGIERRPRTIAAGLSHIGRASDAHQRRGGRVAMAHTLSHRVTSEARASDQRPGRPSPPRSTTALCEANASRLQVVEGRPPSTVDVPADDGSTYRYCLAEWAQSGPSAVYTFLYRV